MLRVNMFSQCLQPKKNGYVLFWASPRSDDLRAGRDGVETATGGAAAAVGRQGE